MAKPPLAVCHWQLACQCPPYLSTNKPRQGSTGLDAWITGIIITATLVPPCSSWMPASGANYEIQTADRVLMPEILLKATVFDVERREYSVPGKGPVRRELVVHPGAVTIVPLLDAATVVMIRNYRFSVGRELLELPAGTLEPPEPPLECAGRELEEETGYRAARLQPLCEFYTSPGFTNEHMYVFVATGLTRTSQRLQESEQIRVQTMPLADALAATADGRIVDGKTIAALHVYHHRYGRSA